MRQDNGVPLLLEFFDAADKGMYPPAMLQRELAQRTADFDRLQFFIQLFGSDHTINREATSWAVRPVDENECGTPFARRPSRN